MSIVKLSLLSQIESLGTVSKLDVISSYVSFPPKLRTFPNEYSKIIEIKLLNDFGRKTLN